MEVEEYADAEPLLLANYKGLKQNEGHILPQEKDARCGCAASPALRRLGQIGQGCQVARELAARRPIGRKIKPSLSGFGRSAIGR